MFRSERRIRAISVFHQWNQQNSLPFSSLISTPSTVQQISNDVLLNANATMPSSAGKCFCQMPSYQLTVFFNFYNDSTPLNVFI